MFAGSIVALVTPFIDDQVDEAALGRMIEFHVAGGTAAIVPCGTTGESATFSHAEQYDTIKRVVELIDGRLPVIAGAGSNSTKEAVQLAQAAERAGANGFLSVTPYYNKPTQDGLVAHYTAIGEAVDLPMVLYNVPGRTGCNLLPETAARIAERVRVDSVKEASGSLTQAQQLIDLGIRVLSGEDALNFPLYCLGAVGAISVVANFAPRLGADLYEAVQRQDLSRARELHSSFFELADLAFCETNPIPAKTACAALGLCRDELRLPLVPMTAANKERLLAGLTKHGLLAAAC